jgi:response regulator RpfG family c-di-GMP phosphodiesterase
MTEHEQPPEQPERPDRPTIFVLTGDFPLLKLVRMALSLELAADILGFAGASAEETARYRKPDLLLLDAHLHTYAARELADRLHRIKGLEGVPTLFLNATTALRSESQRYPCLFLASPWKMEALYAAVHELLDHPS